MRMLNWLLSTVLLASSPAMAKCPAVKGVIPIDNVEFAKQQYGYNFWYAVQGSLKQFGSADVDIDGSYGPSTRAALRAFQQEHELSPTGTADTATLGHFVTLWKEYTDVPPFTTKSERVVFKPDFIPEVSAESGICKVTLTWADETKSLDVALENPIADCRLTEFQGVPTYIQSGPVIGVMLDIKARGYGLPLSTPFIAPIIAVYPDRQFEVRTEVFETYAWGPKNLNQDPKFPVWDGPYDIKPFDFNAVNLRKHHWFMGEISRMYRPWDFSDCN
ncbi:peptidoglycan-binding domain-containing protein [Halovulum sp. GXIMD14793]